MHPKFYHIPFRIQTSASPFLLGTRPPERRYLDTYYQAGMGDWV